jgi:Fur family ferric uptake transcriptional regulator
LPPYGGGMSAPAWHSALRSRGYRLTPQRQLVLQAVTDLGHATPEAISESVREVATGLSLSTVYRTLDLLEELGLVTHAHLGHGAPTYHVATDSDHVHLVCRACGAVTEVAPDVVAGVVERLAAERGFQVDVGHFAIFGQCAACSSAETTGAPACPGS